MWLIDEFIRFFFSRAYTQVNYKVLELRVVCYWRVCNRNCLSALVYLNENFFFFLLSIRSTHMSFGWNLNSSKLLVFVNVYFYNYQPVFVHHGGKLMLQMTIKRKNEFVLYFFSFMVIISMYSKCNNNKRNQNVTDNLSKWIEFCMSGKHCIKASINNLKQKKKENQNK